MSEEPLTRDAVEQLIREQITRAAEASKGRGLADAPAPTLEEFQARSEDTYERPDLPTEHLGHNDPDEYRAARQVELNATDWRAKQAARTAQRIALGHSASPADHVAEEARALHDFRQQLAQAAAPVITQEDTTDGN